MDSHLKKEHEIKCFIASLLSLFIIGCAPEPLLEYGSTTPSTALLPIKYSGIIDERARFREIFCAIQQSHGSTLPYDRPCDETLHTLADEPLPEGKPVHLGNTRISLNFVIVPGILQECVTGLIKPFSYARPHIERFGFKTNFIMVSGLGSCSDNAAQIRDAVVKMQLAPEEKLVFIGYSKGAADILEAVTSYAELRERTTAVVTVAGAISGSPIADKISLFMTKLAVKTFNCDYIPGENAAFESLQRSVRLRWLADNKLPESLKYYSLVAYTNSNNISEALKPCYKKLSQVDPRNDSQVVFYDAVVPGGKLLGYLNADHWAVAMPFARVYPQLSRIFLTKNAFPREVLLEAIARYVEESLLSENKP